MSFYATCLGLALAGRAWDRGVAWARPVLEEEPEPMCSGSRSGMPGAGGAQRWCWPSIWRLLEGMFLLGEGTSGMSPGRAQRVARAGCIGGVSKAQGKPFGLSWPGLPPPPLLSSNVLSASSWARGPSMALSPFSMLKTAIAHHHLHPIPFPVHLPLSPIGWLPGLSDSTAPEQSS